MIDYEFFCPLEHNCLKCFLYTNLDDSVIDIIKKASGTTIQLGSNHNRLIFLLEGKAKLLHENVCNSFHAGNFTLIPRKYNCTMNITEDLLIVTVNLHHRFNFCEYFPLQKLYQLKKKLKNEPKELHQLSIHTAISVFLKNLIILISAGIKCTYFHEIKQQELLYYLRTYYSMNDLVDFFSPILNDDTDFAELIYQNYESVKHIAELAAITHYSESGFKKRFLKVFGISPHHWIQKEKAKKLHSEITCTHKNFKEIAMQYHFHSISHFNRFCKKTFGVPPAKLRKQTT